MCATGAVEPAAKRLAGQRPSARSRAMRCGSRRARASASEMRPPVELGFHRAPRCEPVVSLVRSRRAPPVPLIVLPKSCSCRWGPCPPPPSLVWGVCFLSFLVRALPPTNDPNFEGGCRGCRGCALSVDRAVEDVERALWSAVELCRALHPARDGLPPM